MGSIALVLLLLSSADTGGLVDQGGRPPSSGSGGGAPTTSSAVRCSSPSTPTPSAVGLVSVSPTGTFPNGTRVNVTVEVAARWAAPGVLPVALHLPSLFAQFPQSPSGTLSVYLPARNGTLTGTGWSSGVADSGSMTLGRAVTFRGSGNASLTSEKLAVMAGTWYGNLTVEVRWAWTLSSGSRVVPSGWSVPNSTASYPSYLPGVFEPAPYVGIGPSSGSRVTIGSNWFADLRGAVAGRYFFLELENASTGKVAQSRGQDGPAGVTVANVSIVMLNYDHYLVPGAYLVHVHDVCGAMLWSRSANAVYASSARVTFYIDPGRCGPLTFNGSPQANRSSVTVAPSESAYPFRVPSCPGVAFSGWSGRGGIHVSSSGELLVSSSGSFTVRFS